MFPLKLPNILQFAIGRQFVALRKGNDGDANLIQVYLDDAHLKHIDRKVNNGFLARLRGIHQNNSYSVPG